MSEPKKRARNWKTGRRPKLTAEMITRAAGYLSAGIYIDTLGGLLGVSARSVYLWIARGRKESIRLERSKACKPKEEEAIYLQFFQSVEKNIALGEANALIQIRTAASAGTWQAAAWFLERRHPERWARKDRTEHSLDGQPIKYIISEVEKVKPPDESPKPQAEAIPIEQSPS